MREISYEEKTLELIEKRFVLAKEERMKIWKYIQEAQLQGKKICFFGAGAQGYLLYPYFMKKGIKVDFFCDNNQNKWGKMIIDNTLCLSLDQLKEIGDNAIVIITVFTDNDIYDQLKNIGLKEVYDKGFELFTLLEDEMLEYSEEELMKRVRILFSMLEDETSKKIAYYKIYPMLANRQELQQLKYTKLASFPQYFPSDLISLSNEESFVDCGAFDGDTFRDFYKHVDGEYSRYYGFEPDKDFYLKVCRECKESDRRNKVINKGLSDEKGELSFITEGNSFGGIRVGEEGSLKIEVTTIDNEITEEITFIKMDIEGSELDALKGGKEIIKKYKPKLAISVYHKNNDLFEIPTYIKGLNESYKLYLRHHSLAFSDTVLYAL